MSDMRAGGSSCMSSEILCAGTPHSCTSSLNFSAADVSRSEGGGGWILGSDCWERPWEVMPACESCEG